VGKGGGPMKILGENVVIDKCEIKRIVVLL
jgi:hypothetical protein